MSKQIFYGEYSEYQLQALRIPNQVRGQCLNLYVPYFKCLLNANYFSRLTGRVCQNEKYKYSRCRKIQRQRMNSQHLMQMKLNNPAKFKDLSVAPALDSEFSPSILNLTRH